jgi:hypothetical protein
MMEIKRVLNDNGVFVVSVPIIEGWNHSYENDAIKDPALRELHFGLTMYVFTAKIQRSTREWGLFI